MYSSTVPFFVVLLFALVFDLQPVAARLYPTRPVQNTVYHCGKCDPITWIDDGKAPSMQNMGRLTVDLYCKNHYVFTIEQADPDAGMLMFCPPSPRDFQWPQGCNVYTLFFNGDNPGTKQTVYSADFKVSCLSHANLINAKNHTTMETSVLESALGVGGQTLTTISPAASINLPTPTVPASTASDTSETHQSYDIATTVYANPLPGFNNANRPHRNGASFSRGIDMEKLKFRFVFIVWPALIGISMAM